MSGGFGGENGVFGESASSLTFHDPDEEPEVDIDTQADDFRFNFTLPSQDFQNYGANSLSYDDDRLEDNIKMVILVFDREYVDSWFLRRLEFFLLPLVLHYQHLCNNFSIWK